MLGLVCNTQKQKKNLVTRFLSFSHPNVADRSFVCVVAIRYMSTTDVLALSHSTFMIVYGIYLLRLRILAMEFNAASWSTTLVPAAHLYRSMHASSPVTPDFPVIIQLQHKNIVFSLLPLVCLRPMLPPP